MDISQRHPSTQAAIRRLQPNDSLPTIAFQISSEFYTLAQWLIDKLPDDPDLSDALRKLWESKNCAVYLAAVSPASNVSGEPW
jgi:hypothetical protein